MARGVGLGGGGTGLPRLKDTERFAAWLFTIARRSVVNQLRQRYAEQPQVDLDEEPDPADHVVERVDVRRLLGASGPSARAW